MKQKYALYRRIALTMVWLLVYQICFPVMALALTGGPSQPEVSGFEPIGTADMVDNFTGDFMYNVPLLDVDGYPVNLTYHQDPTMDAESSWVGLNFSLNTGVLHRQMRGFPDDFKDENITKQFNLKEDKTVGISVGAGIEVAGFFGISGRQGIFHNTYRGFGTEFGVSPSLSLGDPNKGNLTANLGLSANFNSQSGFDLSGNAGIGFTKKESENRFQLNFGTGFNSRRGLKDLTLSGGRYGKVEDKLPRTMTGGATFSLGHNTYFPTSPLPLKNTSFSFHGTIGTEGLALHPNATINGYVTKQSLAVNQTTQKAYGYLYSTEGQRNLSALQDFNWDGERVYREDIPTLPMAFGTYDLFSATGQGMGGQFRIARNDIGVFRNARHTNNSSSTNGGGEIGIGIPTPPAGLGIVHAGGDINTGISNTTSQLWQEDNEALDNLPFTASNQLYEATYFKSSGERTISDPSFFAATGSDDPVRVDLNKRGATVTAQENFEVQRNLQPHGSQVMASTVQRSNREKRNQVFSYLTAKEAAETGLDKTITSYDPNTLIYPSCDVTDRTDFARTQYADHHISEVNITQANGSRYIYGIPAYNKKYKEVTFSIDQPDLSSATFDQNSSDFSLVDYTPDVDNTPNNTKGREHYFEAKDIPPYAHSWLLTAVLSPDYVDVTGDGISDDDLGTAVKLNYSKTEDNYHWRVPVQENKARHQVGYTSDTEDDKATYLYGEKEIWYLHSVESRTMIAQFYTSNRDDGLGVLDEDGGKNTNDQLQKLDSIALFSKSELATNGTNALPIKTVHFEYDYSLCKGLPNHVLNSGDNGKLTLKKVYFTYQHSKRGILNAYQFEYNNLNPNYNIGHYDRWGMYKENPAALPTNLFYPYTLQDNTTPDNIGAWNLTDIILPSGGKITVTYEPDDYAYVQNKRAGQMHFITGFAASSGGSPTANLYDAGTINRFMIVDVPNDVIDLDKAKRRYLDGVDKLYFHCLVDLDGTGNEDYITGYMDYDKANVSLRNSSGQQQLVIPLETISTNNTTIHPISKAAFQTIRLNLPQLAYPGYEADQLDEALIQSLVGLGNEIRNISVGFDANSMAKGWGKMVDTDQKSWVRLCNPTYQKYASSTRVKKIELSDEWNTFTGEATSTYGQEYDYTTELPFFDETLTISSGVAAYEPIMGNEENLMREPLPYKENILLAPDNYYYTEKPIGETLFPAPTIGYSKVTVKNLSYQDVTRTATGKTINEYYTAKDFPVITDYTSKDPKKVRANPILKFFKLKAKEELTVSQGYKVEVNDMHGKPKSESVFNELGALISSTQYQYKTDSEDDEVLHLNNEVQVVQPDGTITTQSIGVDTDIWQGMQEEKNHTEGIGVAFNTEGFIIFIIPAVILPILPIYQEESTRFRSSVTTKFIKRFGILDKVIVTENGSTLTTENLLFDSETGDVLLTKTQNEFNDPMYQFTYPAHWAYEGMEQAYKNIGAVFENITITGGEFQGFDPTPFLAYGDELFIEKEDGTALSGTYYYVEVGANNIVMDSEGQPLDQPGENLRLKIIRSGKRNQAGFPIGATTSRLNPIVGNQISPENSSEVLQASATEFGDVWQIRCSETVDGGVPHLVTGTINPYTSGLHGNWRPLRSYIFYNERSPATLASNTNIQTDGIIQDYEVFWDYNMGSQQWEAPMMLDKWTLTNEITMYDTRGNEIENQDAIGNYSAAYFGYNNNRAVAIASNAQGQEITFESFEDYNFNNTCTNPVVTKNLTWYNPATSILTDQISHSGRYALQLNANSSTTIISNNDPTDCIKETTTPELVGTSMANMCYEIFDNRIDAECCACLPNLLLTPDEDYVVSLWVATDNSLACGAAPTDVELELTFKSGTNTLGTFTATPTGVIIDGWQRIEETFTVPLANIIEWTLKNDNITDAAYYDDFRIHPFFSNQRSFVYDPQSLRLMAELDENNYASFYEYDDEGTLIRVKRETEKGVVTVQEARTLLKSNN